ncbi:hypothetical protein [Micromonospora sp. NPDC049679]|uniref:hypothetical protein n=1 Tax=Micromonospora sp. NPDC049679 TaxID=3155920 RepID=UPI0033C2EE3D
MAEYPPIHAPLRPSWLCTACGEEWPCITRKRQLKELLRCDVQRLRRYMHPYVPIALVELDELDEARVHERFVSWCGKPL